MGNLLRDLFGDDERRRDRTGCSSGRIGPSILLIALRAFVLPMSFLHADTAERIGNPLG